MAANRGIGQQKPWSEVVQRAARHWGGDGSIMNNPLEHQATPPVTGSAGGDLFPHYLWDAHGEVLQQ